MSWDPAGYTIETIQTVMQAIREFGVEVVPKSTGEIFYPVRDFIVTPAEMLEILKK